MVDRPESKFSKKYREIRKLLHFGNHPFPILKLLLNLGLLKIALSDQEKKPHTSLYVPLCRSHLKKDQLDKVMTFDHFVSCHDTFDLAAKCTGKRGSIGVIDLNEMAGITDW